MLLEKLTGLEFELKRDIALQIREPLGMASLKGAIFVLVRGQGVERSATVALLMLLEVWHSVISHEALQQVQLEIVLSIEALATLSLQECIIIVFVALVS